MLTTNLAGMRFRGLLAGLCLIRLVPDTCVLMMGMIYAKSHENINSGVPCLVLTRDQDGVA